MSAPATPVEATTVAELCRQGYSNSEIAEILGLPYNSVKARVYESGLKAVRKPRRRTYPSCNDCAARAACIRSVLAGGPFARQECNPCP
jgi:hypothetical protein